MARSLNEIYDGMIAEKQSMPNLQNLQPNIDSLQTLLSDLTSTSKVAIWRLLFWCVAFAVWVSENMIELFISKNKPGTVYWYYEQCKNFQYGDALILQDGKYIYNPVNPANRIIKYASADEDSIGNVILKVAKDSSGSPTPLLLAEYNAFEAYINTVKFAGTSIIIRSDVADILKVGMTIHYDPLVLASNGSLLSDPSTYPVKDTINAYIKSLDFDGIFTIQQLVDKVQNAKGVKICTTTMCQAKYGLTPYVNILNEAAQAYRPFAGYMNISVAGGETLNDTLSYLPYV